MTLNLNAVITGTKHSLLMLSKELFKQLSSFDTFSDKLREKMQKMYYWSVLSHYYKSAG